MKTLNLILAAVIISSFTFAQSPIKLVKERVGDNDLLKNWQVNEVRASNNVKIERVAGENSANYRTNIAFIPNNNILNDIYAKAQTEPLYLKEYEELEAFYSDEAVGGQIAIFYDRNDQQLADPRNFTVEVRNDATGEIIHETGLDYQTPYYYKWDIHYMYSVVNIPVAVGESFTINVKDEGLQETFEFHVYDNNGPAPVKERNNYTVAQ